MTNTKSTKRALFSSVVALILCFSMLLGTTFAWFTDSVTSGANVIQAGTLDVDLYMWKGAVTDDTNRVEITNESTPIFGGAGSLAAQNDPANTLWEPGKTQVVYLSIANNGSLDLKYKVAIEVYDVKNNLIDVLEYAITPDATWNATPVAWNGGEKVVRGTNVAANDVTLKAKTEHFFALSVHMLEGAGNEYQAGNAYFNIKLLATQLGSESDSFGNGYDAGATYPNVSAPTPLDTEAKINGVTLKTDAVEVKVPADVVNALPTTVESLSLTYESSVNNSGASVFENVELIDQDGNIVDLSGNTEPMEVTLILPNGHGLSDGESVIIYHDGVAVDSATVTDGKISYTATHFCTVEVKRGYIVDSADKLVNAINNSKDNSVIFINAGEYTFASQLTINNKSLDIIGLGEVNLISKGGANTHVFQLRNGAENSVAKDGMVVTIKNVNIDGNYKSAIMVRNDLDLYLENVTFAGTYNWSTLQVENSYDNESKFDGIVNIYAKNVTSEKVTMAADDGRTTYFNYEDCTFGLIEVQNLGGEVIINEIKTPTPGATFWVKNVTELKSALDKAVGATTIFLTEDISGDVTITQEDGVNLVIDGNGKKFTGVMTVFGDARQKEAETLVIKNINFIAANGKDSCIYSPDRAAQNPARYSYSHNVTVENCTFTDPDGNVNCAAIRHGDGGDRNWVVKGCVVDNTMHSLLQVNNVEGKLIVSDCKVYSKNGANLNSTTNLEMTGCEFDVKGYTVRFGVNKGGNLGTAKNYLIANSTLKSACEAADDAVIVFRASAVDAVLTLNNTILDGKVEMMGNTADTTIIIDGVYHVASAAALAAVVANGATDIYLLPGEYDVYGCGGKTLTISGSKDAVLKLYNEGEEGCDYGFGGNGTGVGNITFNGVTIDTTANTGNYKGYAYMKGTFNDCNFVGAYSLNNANDFEFNRCTFDFKNGYFWTWGANSVTFNDCIFNGNSKNILAHGWASTTIIINDCDFAATEKGYANSGKDWTAAVEIDPAGTNIYTINFTGKNTITENYSGWTRVKDGSTGHTITGLN